MQGEESHTVPGSPALERLVDLTASLGCVSLLLLLYAAPESRRGTGRSGRLGTGFDRFGLAVLLCRWSRCPLLSGA